MNELGGSHDGKVAIGSPHKLLLDIELPANIGEAPTFVHHSGFAFNHATYNRPQKIH